MIGCAISLFNRLRGEGGGGVVTPPFSVSWDEAGARWAGAVPASLSVIWDAAGARWN